MTKSKIKAGIIGGAGYTGGETTRLLVNHPNAELVFVQSRSQAGKPIAEVHHDLVGETTLRFSDAVDSSVDVIFLCLGHGESKKMLAETPVDSRVRLIDLGNDFRLGEKSGDRDFVYGLPEFNRDAIKRSSNIANPGCFATTIQLAVLPLAKGGLLSDVTVTGITGSTGAGQKLQDTTHFTWRANNISGYKTLTHQHLGEIKRTFGALQAGFNGAVNFIPWRGDFTRGIFASAVVTTKTPITTLQSMYKDYYAGHPFTHVSDEMINMKQVVNTNKCMLHLEKDGDTLVIHSTLDNLLKGASGQAVQNMNLMFGFDETAGLRLKSTVY